MTDLANFYTVLAPIVASTIWLAAGFKLRDLRKDPHDLALWALYAVLVFGALAWTFAIPWVYVRVDHAVGIPNVAILLSYGCIMVDTAFAQLLLLTWSCPREQVWVRIRWRLVGAVLVLASMVWLFLMASVPKERPFDFESAYATTPYVTAMLLVFYPALGFGMPAVGWLCWRYANMVGRLWLRRGLRLVTAGTALVCGYCACMLVHISGRLAGGDLYAWNTAALFFAFSAVPVLCVGLTLPAWGPRLSAMHAWLDRYRAYRKLHPLWLALYRAVPEIAFIPPTSPGTDLPPLRDLDFRLYRRVIEIHDGWLALRPYLSSQITVAARRLAEAAGLNGDELWATTEAANLKAALHIKAHSGTATTLVPANDGDRSPSPVSASLADEIALLIQVAQAFRSSPVVTAALEADTTSKTQEPTA